MLQKNTKTQKIIKWLRKNPNGTRRKFEMETGIKTSEGRFYVLRKRLKSEAINTGINNFLNSGNKKKRIIKANIIRQWLVKNPEGKHDEFMKETGIKCSNGTFYHIRKNYISVLRDNQVSIKNNRNKIYMTIFSDTSDIPESAKILLKKFVASLNNMKRTRFEVVEYVQPKMIEVREVK